MDLFGRVRRNLEAANASLQSTAADLVNVQLVLTSELAADYFNLSELDAEIAVVQELVSIEQKGLDLVQHRHDGGVANGLEVAQQAALLDATVAQVSLLQQQRAQYEHAIAVLTGNPASSFSVPVAPLRAVPPPVPLGVPSDVLERRPDISTYERLMAYQNAQVGIATTAFYPHITLSGSGGWQSRDIATLGQRAQRLLVTGERPAATDLQRRPEPGESGGCQGRIQRGGGKLPGGGVDRVPAS